MCAYCICCSWLICTSRGRGYLRATVMLQYSRSLTTVGWLNRLRDHPLTIWLANFESFYRVFWITGGRAPWKGIQLEMLQRTELQVPLPMVVPSLLKTVQLLSRSRHLDDVANCPAVCDVFVWFVWCFILLLCVYNMCEWCYFCTYWLLFLLSLSSLSLSLSLISCFIVFSSSLTSCHLLCSYDCVPCICRRWTTYFDQFECKICDSSL